MIKKLRNQPYTPKWEQEEEKKNTIRRVGRTKSKRDYFNEKNGISWVKILLNNFTKR
jgi:hypothetical protein